VIDIDGEELGVGEGDTFGKAEEEDATGDFTEGVLDFGKTEDLGLKVVFGDIHKVFGVFHDELEELKEFFNGPEVVFGNVLLGALS